MTEDHDEAKSVNPRLEIEAMSVIAESLEPLESAARARVLRWAYDLFLAEEVSAMPSFQPSSGLEEGSSQQARRRKSVDSPEVELRAGYDSLPELYGLVQPKQDAAKALVVAYWLQKYEGFPDIDTQSVNGELKHLGHRVTNITRAFDRLVKTKPQLVMQTRKQGKSKQGRKKFKLTLQGERFIESLASGGEFDSQLGIK